MEPVDHSAFRLALVALFALAGIGPAQAQQSVEEFYRGRKIDFAIGYSSGGTYDLGAAAGDHRKGVVPAKAGTHTPFPRG